MHLTMFRETSKGAATLSKLFNKLDFVCDVLEDEVREIEGVPVSEWKLHGITAIPHGVYKLTLETSTRFGPNTITVNNVPGYTGVRGHAGNRSSDTEGCLLFGIRNSENTIGASRDHLATVKALIKEAIDSGEEVTIEIFPASE